MTAAIETLTEAVRELATILATLAERCDKQAQMYDANRVYEQLRKPTPPAPETPNYHTTGSDVDLTGGEVKETREVWVHMWDCNVQSTVEIDALDRHPIFRVKCIARKRIVLTVGDIEP